MEEYFVTLRFQPNTVQNLRLLRDFLEKAENALKNDEDAELDLVCHVNSATTRLVISKLKPTETYNPNEPYEVEPIEHLECLIKKNMGNGLDYFHLENDEDYFSIESLRK